MSPQQQIAHYRITSKLGEGGMGAVYRATDTKLSREVAIKVLPEAFAADPDRLARFTREAQVLASLNHPGIAAIYGVEDRALVMELVEGENLKGPLPLEEALGIARQIAEALEYAHERGIVHRDLKPANIKVTPEGRVKLLDFGLAKAVSGESSPGDAAVSPTLTMRATIAGTIIGTAAYMSPEQARGHAVDRRADIWAFGVVFFEILTGRQLFGGPTISDSLAAVLKTEPEVSAVPPQVQPIIERCLRKDPKRRWQAIGDVRIALEEPPAETSTAMAGPATHRTAAVWPIAVAVLALGFLVTGGLLWRVTHPPDRALMRLNLDLGADSIPGNYTTAAISPDGMRLVFLVRGSDGTSQLATRLLSQSKSTVLPGTRNASDPFYSPDGQSIGFFADGKLKTTSVQGGAPQTLATAPSARGGAWLNDGTIVAALSLSGIFRIPAAGGTPARITDIPETGSTTNRWPQALPGGNAILLTSGVPGDLEDGNIEVLNLKTGTRTVVLRGGYYGRYVPGGHLVYMHQGSLFAVRFDLDPPGTRGTAAQALDDVASDPTSGAAQFDFSQTGAFVYMAGSSMGSRRLSWLDSSGALQPLPVSPGPYLMPRVSPDGSKVALWGAPASTLDLWAYEWQRDRLLRLTFNGVPTRNPVWAADGKHIAFGAPNFIGWVRADGAGGEQRLVETASLALPSSISPDGRRLAYYQFTSKTDFDIWTIPMDLADPDHPKAGKPELFLGSSAGERNGAFSPDGRWMAYDSTQTGTYEIFVRPFPSGSAQWQVSTGGGMFPYWSRDGKQLFYETLDGRIMVTDCAATSDSFEAGTPRLWSTRRIATTFPYPNLALHPDGKRFLVYPSAEGSSDSSGGVHAVFLLNFVDELKRRVP